MTPPVRIALKIGAILSLLVAIVVVALPLAFLGRLESSTVAGPVVIVLTWIADASAA